MSSPSAAPPSASPTPRALTSSGLDVQTIPAPQGLGSAATIRQRVAIGDAELAQNVAEVTREGEVSVTSLAMLLILEEIRDHLAVIRLLLEA